MTNRLITFSTMWNPKLSGCLSNFVLRCKSCECVSVLNKNTGFDDNRKRVEASTALLSQSKWDKELCFIPVKKVKIFRIPVVSHVEQGWSQSKLNWIILFQLFQVSLIKNIQLPKETMLKQNYNYNGKQTISC